MNEIVEASAVEPAPSPPPRPTAVVVPLVFATEAEAAQVARALMHEARSARRSIPDALPRRKPGLEVKAQRLVRAAEAIAAKLPAMTAAWALGAGQR